MLRVSSTAWKRPPIGAAAQLIEAPGLIMIAWEVWAMGLFGKQRKVKCPDGSRLTVYKDLDDAFPLYIPGFDAKFGANIEGIAGASGNLTAEYATKINGLLYSLNEVNQSLMMSFRGIYAIFQGDPCGNADLFRGKVTALVEEQSRLNRAKLKIRALIDIASLGPSDQDGNRVLTMYQDIVQELGGAAAPTAAELNIPAGADPELLAAAS